MGEYRELTRKLWVTDYECQRCGALVVDRERHDAWHGDPITHDQFRRLFDHSGTVTPEPWSDSRPGYHPGLP